MQEEFANIYPIPSHLTEASKWEKTRERLFLNPSRICQRLHPQRSSTLIRKTANRGSSKTGWGPPGRQLCSTRRVLLFKPGL